MKALIYMVLTGIAMYLGYVFAECPDRNIEAVCLTGVVLILTLDVIAVKKNFEGRR